MDLSQLVSLSVSEEGAWFDYPTTAGSFKVKILFLKRPLLQKMTKDATVIVRSKANKFRAVTEYSDDTFQQEFAKKAIQQWTGCSPAVLRDLLPGYDLVGTLTSDVEASDTNKVWLFQNSAEFQNWVTAHCTEIEEHKKDQKVAELENLNIAPSGR